MHKQNLLDLIEFDEKKFQAKLLVNQPGYRVVLLNLRAGQNMPQHSAKEMLMVYAMAGHITFYEGENPTDVRAGEVIWIGAGVPHWLAAHEDSSLLVVRAGDAALPVQEEELDLREIPRVQRSSLQSSMGWLSVSLLR